MAIPEGAREAASGSLSLELMSDPGCALSAESPAVMRSFPVGSYPSRVESMSWSQRAGGQGRKQPPCISSFEAASDRDPQLKLI